MIKKNSGASARPAGRCIARCWHTANACRTSSTCIRGGSATAFTGHARSRRRRSHACRACRSCVRRRWTGPDAGAEDAAAELQRGSVQILAAGVAALEGAHMGAVDARIKLHRIRSLAALAELVAAVGLRAVERGVAASDARPQGAK